MSFPVRSILVSDEVFDRLASLARDIKRQRGKAITFSEVVEELLDFCE